MIASRGMQPRYRKATMFRCMLLILLGVASFPDPSRTPAQADDLSFVSIALRCRRMFGPRTFRFPTIWLARSEVTVVMQRSSLV